MSHRSIKVHPTLGTITYTKKQFLLDHPNRNEVVPRKDDHSNVIVYRPTFEALKFYAAEGALRDSAWTPGTRTQNDSGLIHSFDENSVTFWIGLSGRDQHTTTVPIEEIKEVWTTRKTKSEMIALHHAFNSAVIKVYKNS